MTLLFLVCFGTTVGNRVRITVPGFGQAADTTVMRASSIKAREVRHKTICRCHHLSFWDPIADPRDPCTRGTTRPVLKGCESELCKGTEHHYARQKKCVNRGRRLIANGSSVSWLCEKLDPSETRSASTTRSPTKVRRARKYRGTTMIADPLAPLVNDPLPATYCRSLPPREPAAAVLLAPAPRGPAALIAPQTARA